MIYKKGSKGEEVKKIQQALNLKVKGSSLKVDGIFGSGTYNTVRKFQKENELIVDGIVGPSTWDALGLNASEIKESTATITDKDGTKVTAFISSDSAGYSTIGGVATKKYPSGVKTFRSDSKSITSSDEFKIQGITSRVFHQVAFQISEYENTLYNQNEVYTIKDFIFRYPLGLNIPPISLNALKKEQERAELRLQNIQVTQKIELQQVESDKIKNSTPDELKAKGLSKLSQIIFNLGRQIPILILPPLNRIVQEEINQLIEDQCPEPVILDEIIDFRNKIVFQLNNISSNLETTGSTLTGLSNFLIFVQTSLKSVDIASLALSLATKFTPVTPGAVSSLLNDAQTFIRKATFNDLGESKLSKVNSNINSATLSISLISNYIYEALNYITIIDNIINKCKPDTDLTPISKSTQDISDLQKLASDTLNQSTYQGFILEVETVPFTPTVNRYRAIGKNSQNITLIKSELSFTSNPLILISELKFIIDRDNLKAY